MVVLLGAVALVTACGSSGPRKAALYSRAATKSCLLARSGVVAGLPPTTPPRPPVIFVDALRYDDLSTGGVGARPGPHGQLGAWTSGKRGYAGVILTFFRSPRAARRALKTLEWLNHDGKQIGNVDATWDLAKSLPLRNVVLGCLRTHVSRRSPTHPAPQATLATFAGDWGGHTRGLRITQSGTGHEYANAGCCYLAYAMNFRILSTRGTITHGWAKFRVTSYRIGPAGGEVKIHPRDVGELELVNGIVTNKLSHDYFCSNPAWGVGGACGA